MEQRPEVLSGLLPQLELDELLGELQSRLQAVLGTRDRMKGLLEAVVAVGSGLDLETTLHRIVEAAVNLANARYGALGVIGEGGGLAQFVPVGLEEHQVAQIDHWPEGKGLLGLLIRDPRPVRLADIKSHSESVGFPPGHPPMRGFLGVPVLVRGEVFGNLYLTEKQDGSDFSADDEALVSALGTAAGVAIENAHLYEDSRRRQRWLAASSEVTTRLLSGTDQAQVMAALTMQALELSGGDLAVVALPDPDRQRLIIEYADGEDAEAARGLVLPLGESLSGRVFETGEAQTVVDFSNDERAAAAARIALPHLGPAVLVPLGAPDNVRGVFTIGRRHGAAPFSQDAVEVAASFAAQAGVALELADRRRDAEQLRVFEDRDRIARDLHDQVIQRLYAAGMSLQATAPMAADPAVRKRMEHVVDEMDEVIAEIRTAIFSLQSRRGRARSGLRAGIVTVAEEMTPLLGFAPTVRLGAGLDENVTAEPAEHLLTVLREALSNTARHANATTVEVSVEAGGDLVLRVTDNGIGMGTDTRRSGLANMAERAQLLGGALRISPADESAGTGTILEWRVPRQ